MKKYFNKRALILCTLLTIIVGLDTPFGTWIYSQIFAMVKAADKRRVVIEIALITVVLALFTLARYLYSRVLNKNIYLFNQNVRSDLLSSNFVKQKSAVSDKLSFITNDLDLIETNYVREGFTLLATIVSLVVNTVFALHANLLLTLIFMVFSSLSAVAPKIMANKVMVSSQNWSASVSKYTSFMSDYLKHIDVILHYKAMPFLLLRGKRVINAMVSAKQKRENTIALSNLIAGLLAYALEFLPIGVGIIFVIDGRLELSSFILVQYSSSWIVICLSKITITKCS